MVRRLTYPSPLCWLKKDQGGSETVPASDSHIAEWCRNSERPLVHLGLIRTIELDGKDTYMSLRATPALIETFYCR